MKRTILSTIILLALAGQALGQYPSYTNRIYWPGMWRPEQPWGKFQLGNWNQDKLNVTWQTQLDGSIAYPYYTCNTLGVNDTLKFMVILDNRSTQNIPLKNLSPETWFYPVLFDPYVDVFISEPVADTSAFKYRFEYWQLTVNGAIVAKPDTLFSLPTSGYHKRFALIYSIWDVSPGLFRVILKPGALKPEFAYLSLANGNNLIEIAKGRCLQDTLNSIATIATSALGRREMTLFNNCVNDIFSLNPQSLIGWALRYHGYNAQSDTTNARVALDSILYNLNNRIDPLIPDSSNISPIENSWLRQWNADYQHYRARMLYPWNWSLPPR